MLDALRPPLLRSEPRDCAHRRIAAGVLFPASRTALSRPFGRARSPPPPGSAGTSTSNAMETFNATRLDLEIQVAMRFAIAAHGDQL